MIAGTSSNTGGPSSAALNSLVAFSVKTQSSVHFKINSISELINKKSKLNMKLLIFLMVQQFLYLLILCQYHHHQQDQQQQEHYQLILFYS